MKLSTILTAQLLILTGLFMWRSIIAITTPLLEPEPDIAHTIELAFAITFGGLIIMLLVYVGQLIDKHIEQGKELLLKP
jgi:hypothetical protein